MQFHLKITCADQPGIIAAVTSFLHCELSANILDLNHHSEEEGLFFLACRFSVPSEKTAVIETLSSHPLLMILQKTYGWDWSLHSLAVKPKVALLVTQTDHCLYELILKTLSGYLPADIRCVVSNRETLRPVAERFGLPFHHFPVGDDRRAQEGEVDAVLRDAGVETLVLARYMQILTSDFIRRWPDQIINVHHGFLPAFKGAKPYHQAWAKGVKIIGATAHYATEDLDEGPILYQDVAPVHDNRSVKGFIEAGQDIERKVIVEGLKLHLERRVFLHNGRTIIL